MLRKDVSDLNRKEELGALEAIQYGRGGEDGEDNTKHIYEIKSNFSNIGVKGMINMLNVIAKIIPDKQLNEPWSQDEETRLQQAAQKFTRLCELLSRKNHEIFWENKDTHRETLSAPFGTLMFLINYRPAYDWRFIPGHFQIEPYTSDVTDWRLAYDGIPFPNEWLAYFYRTLDETKAVEDDNYGSTTPLVFIYNSKLRSLEDALRTISFVLYKAIMQKTLKQFTPLIARWIDLSIPLNDELAKYQLSLILSDPATQEIKAIADLLKNPKFMSIKNQLNQWKDQDPKDVIRQLLQQRLPLFPLLLRAYSLGPTQEMALNLSHNLTITGPILKKINMFTKLTSLDLEGNQIISDTDLQNLTNLTTLNLGANYTITDTGLKNLPQLTSLSLSFNRKITDAGLKNLKNLIELNLGRNQTITNAGLQNLKSLSSLNLAGNEIITNAGLQNLTQLTSLDLLQNDTITDAGLQNLKNLIELNLVHNQTITYSFMQDHPHIRYKRK